MLQDPISSDPNRRHFWRLCALYTFFGALALFLLTEHRAHVIGLLPFLLLAACPLMHVFMHHHDHHHAHANLSQSGNEHDSKGGTKQNGGGQR